MACSRCRKLYIDGGFVAPHFHLTKEGSPWEVELRANGSVLCDGASLYFERSENVRRRETA
jgi:hypothetical protein